MAESPPSPTQVLGPFYFGVVVGTFLYGILVLQAITYYQNFKRDKVWLRLLILYLFVVETCSSGVAVAMIYEPLVQQFGTDKPMSLFPSLLPLQPILEAAVFVPVQFFYAWRISVIMRNMFIPLVICVTSLTSAVGAVWTGIIVHQVKEYLNKPKVNNTALIWSVCAAGTDVIITASLIWSLRNRKTGVRRTDDAINTIVRNAVQTGGVTVAFTVLDVVLFVALSHSTLNFVFDFGVPKLYSNALISTLNARSGGGNPGQNAPNVLFSGSNSRHVGSSSQHMPSAQTNTHKVVIEMNTVVEREMDDDMLALGDGRAHSDNPYGEPK
ncbi:MFS domain-containing protein [Mycena sanguinolenta]|uniref:MFS domain-containing protein n=1 Tax=Mycena sanguinolenta TaxID=230812 RepID=A0A8H6ZDQ0_9AGAR|nr:MFS domain-containing protein [Mycena sanguinolenta]